MSPAAETLERRTRVLIEEILDLRPQFRLFWTFALEVLQEPLRRTSPRALSRRAPDRLVGGDHPHLLPLAVLGREALDDAVRVRREPHGEVAMHHVVANSVEDHDAASAAQGDEARELVDQLVAVTKPAGVQNVVAVEEVEHPNLRMTPPRRGAVR